MKYMGSKARIAKEILPIILQERKDSQWYFEPFAGGMNVICNVDGKRIANDNNIYLIEMWKGLVSNKDYPINITKNMYDEARNQYNSGLHRIGIDELGWIGWMGSANGRFFDGGYSGVSDTKIGTKRNYIEEAINNITKQIPLMKDVVFTSKHYSEFQLKEPCIIYCDPPYKGTKQYSTSKYFDHDKFWEWCRNMTMDGHSVFISEYSAPEDFECVWSKELSSSLRSNSKISGDKKSIERLFKLKSA